MDERLKSLFVKACEAVVAGAKDSYAKAYAQCGLRLAKGEEAPPQGCTLEETLKTQALYILNNLQYWRGPEAVAAKARLREVAGVK